MRKITILLLTLFSGISHVIYGLMSIVLPFYDEEFIRYGFENFRYLIGSSQIIFGVCLILGLYFNKLKLISSLFLALLMGGALGTRIYIGDDFLQSLPALSYLLINLFIFIESKNLIK
ncbi:MAG: hypothetical protein CMC83_01535 [Flavobacteriaceae bacterium]|nr:hypothetical protein [Flavobacteriaceae bacterium]|tara:strand:+ start:138 stop:491 length:354 start_codon:yes stop_codon:yes gene_type:complete